MNDNLSRDQFGLPGGYSMHTREQESTERWGLPALNVSVTHGGKSVAHLGVHQRSFEDRGRVGHPNVYVDDEHQHKGIATAMYAEVHKRWPTTPIEHSAHASEAARGLNQSLQHVFPDLHREPQADQ